MKLLLDTHIWLWSIGEPHRLSRRVAQALNDPENELWLSSVSLWEAFLLHRKKRLKTSEDFQVWAASTLAQIPLSEAPMTFEVVLALPTVKLTHSDPADHLLAASAKAFGFTLVTSDQNLIRAEGFSVLPNS